MKLMKHITIALVLCAIPAMALGQVNVTCDECKHMVPIFMGDGGLVAEAADGAEEVSYLSTCGGVTSWGSEMVTEGMVGISFQDKGLACAGDDGTFTLGPIKDGGWYWITEESNSAVGSLLHADVYEALMGSETEPTSAGGVEVTSQNGAALLKHPATGRVGILSTLLPVVPDSPTRVCGYSTAGTTHTRINTMCTLGNGGHTILATTTNSLTGTMSRVMDEGMIARPGGTGSYDIVIDLWGNASGHYTTDAAGDARLGNPSAAMGAGAAGAAARTAARMTGVTFTAQLSGGTGPGATDVDLTATDHGVVATAGTPTDGITLTVSNQTTSYCTATARHNAVIKVTAGISDAGATAITPAMVRSADATTTPGNIVGTFTFTLTCPAASSQLGVELVPENPFPTE